MGTIISKIHQGQEIVIGEISVKKNHNPVKPNQMVTIFKVFHAGIGSGSQEDLFAFFFHPHVKQWVLEIDKSFICIDIESNHRLIEDIYSKISSSKMTTIQEFTDLIYDEHFEVFIEANKKASKKTGIRLRDIIKRIFF